MKIAIAGASGFVGQLLLKELASDHEIIALGRSVQGSKQTASENPALDKVTWRSCDLFSMLQCEMGLEGADIGIYLVHSMLPRAALTQSTFEDCDLLLADNFARAAKKMKLKRIIYLSGLIPPGEKLSKHLESRKEVEKALSSWDVPVTTLRSGLILGSQGSSFQMLYLLVKRLPIMLCPAWTRTRTQCIAAADVVGLIRQCIHDPTTTGQTFDIGEPDILTYRDLMEVLAQEMGKRRVFIPVPFLSPGLSRLWIQLITGASKNLVKPLVESLQHEMVAQPSRYLKLKDRPMLRIREALRLCLPGIKPSLRSTTRERKKSLSSTQEVRSIQRLPLPREKTAGWLAREYFRWLPTFLRPIILVHPDKSDSDTWIFRSAFSNIPLLILWHSQERSTEDRQLFYIRGGVLALKNSKANARLEFRSVLEGQAGLAAIHDFKTSLPWILYKYTQALVHLGVMAGFRRHLRKLMQD